MGGGERVRGSGEFGVKSAECGVRAFFLTVECGEHTVGRVRRTDREGVWLGTE